ncbi:hypothetical protein ABW21_db0202884 [Orbilia brochopaga]|nr:hypothetical protein ABW21_db0202884 [Drechslerella brochopaga]
MTANIANRSASLDAGTGVGQKLPPPAPNMLSAPPDQQAPPSNHKVSEDGKTTMPLDFPFELKDAIAIFKAIMIKSKEANPFADSIQRDWHSQIWMSIRFHANFPKVAGSSGATTAADGSPRAENIELKDHVVTLMRGLEEARNKEIHKVYIENVKSREQTLSQSENQAAKDKFLGLVQSVYRLWRQRNDGPLPPPEAPLLLPPILPPAKSDVGVQTSSKHQASLHDPVMVSPVKPNGPEKTAPAGLPSPADTSDTISDRTEAEEANKSISPSGANAPENCHLITLPINTPPPSNFASALHIAEIWRVTINRLYASHNGSLTKFRRPNWLLHLETRGVQTVSDLGGWRGGDESTRQLTNNLITKLHETGYSTKGIQSKIKSILTIDVAQALENLKSGNFEKFKPVPLDLMRNAWAPDASTPHSAGREAGEFSTLSAGSGVYDDSPLDWQQAFRKRPVDPETETPARAKRICVGPDDMTPSSIPYNSVSETSEYPICLRRQSSSSNIPVSALVHATAETGFTPINRAAFSQIIPPPTPTPIEQHIPAIPAIPRVPAIDTTTITKPPVSRLPMERPRSPASTIDQRDHHERQDRDMSSPDEFQSTTDDAVEIFVEGRLNSFRQTIQDIRSELVETRQAQVDHATVVAKTRDEFDSFKKDFHEDYCHVRNTARDNAQRIKALECDLKSSPSSSPEANNTGPTVQQQLEDAKTTVTLLSNLLQYRDNGISEQVDGLVEGRMNELDAAATEKVNDLETRISTSVEELSAKIDTDMKQLASANDKVNERMDKLEAKMESVDADVKEIMNAISAIMLKVMGSRSSGAQALRS